MKITEKQNEVKNKVLEHINIAYNIDHVGMDIITETIDSVFFFQEELRKS